MQLAQPLRFLLCVCVLAIGIGLSGCGEAASPDAVIADFNAGGFVDGQLDADPEIDVRHTLSDLEHAKRLMQIQNPANLPQFLTSVNAYIDQNLLGINPPTTPGPAGPSNIPQVDTPTWAVLTAGAAGLLALGGIGSAIYRRTRRRTA